MSDIHLNPVSHYCHVLGAGELSTALDIESSLFESLAPWAAGPATCFLPVEDIANCWSSNGSGGPMTLISRFRSKFANTETNTQHSFTEYEALKRQYPR